MMPSRRHFWAGDVATKLGAAGEWCQLSALSSAAMSPASSLACCHQNINKMMAVDGV